MSRPGRDSPFCRGKGAMLVFNICPFVPLIVECHLIGMRETFCIYFLGIQSQHVLPHLPLAPFQVCCKVLAFSNQECPGCSAVWAPPCHNERVRDSQGRLRYRKCTAEPLELCEGQYVTCFIWHGLWLSLDVPDSCLTPPPLPRTHFIGSAQVTVERINH